MAFGDIIGGLVFDNQDSNQIHSYHNNSFSDSSSDEEDDNGIVGSFLGFMGFGKNKKTKIKYKESTFKENSNVYDYKPTYIRESS